MIATSPKNRKSLSGTIEGGNGTVTADLSECHDITLNCTDLTPTIPESVASGARLVMNSTKNNASSSISGGQVDDDINRAQALLQRASLLSNISSCTSNLTP